MSGPADASTGFRSPRTAVLVGLSLALYVGLNAWFYYDGFFRHGDAPLIFSPFAIYREIAPGTISIISWSRIPIRLASGAALGGAEPPGGAGPRWRARHASSSTA